MIRPLAATKLAYTKLKTRRLRLAISLIIVSLLFSMLIAGAIVQAGFFASLNRFSSEGLAGRYVVAGTGGPVVWGETFSIAQNPALIERAETLQEQYIKQKNVRAEALGVQYDSGQDTAVMVNPNGTKNLILTAEITKQVIAEYREELRQADETSFKEQLLDLQPEALYRIVSQQQSDSSLLPIRDGKEPTAAELSDYRAQSYGFGGITQGSWQLIDSELMQSFLLDNQSMNIGEDGSIPVIAPSYAIEQELGLEPLPADASPQQKRERLEELRSKAAGMTFGVCYRNKPSRELFNKAVAQQSDKATNGDKKNYVSPSLLYGLPESACGVPVVEHDKRNAAEKQQAQNQQKFNQEFAQPEPVSEVLKFRVVGIKKDHDPYASNQGGDFTPEQIFDSAFSSNVGQGWLSPLSAGDQNQIVATLFEQDDGDILGSVTTYFAEFASADDAKHALLQKSCTPSYGIEEKGLLGTKLEINSGHTCSREGTQFTLQPFGSNAIAIDQFKDLSKRALFIGAAVTAALAAIVLMGMVSRIIADSRKETAIFRAVGATRLSIVQVYFTYTGFLVLWIVGLSLLFGLLAAYIFNSQFSPDFSIAAAVAFSVQDLSQQFTFIGLNWANLGIILLVVAVASYLAAMFPIFRSVRRNPMADMREE